MSCSWGPRIRSRSDARFGSPSCSAPPRTRSSSSCCSPPACHVALAAAVTLMGVLQPQYVYFSDALYAETFFGLFTVLFFVLRRYRRDTLGFVLCGVCAVLAYEARTAGIALLAAWVVDHALRKDAAGADGARRLGRRRDELERLDQGRRVVAGVPAACVRLPDRALALLQRELCAQPADVQRSIFPELGPLTPSGFVRRVEPNLRGPAPRASARRSAAGSAVRARGSARHPRARRAAAAGDAARIRRRAVRRAVVRGDVRDAVPEAVRALSAAAVPVPRPCAVRAAWLWRRRGATSLAGAAGGARRSPSRGWCRRDRAAATSEVREMYANAAPRRRVRAAGPAPSAIDSSSTAREAPISTRRSTG